MSMDNDLFADAARDVLADQCTPAVVRAIEKGGRTAQATTNTDRCDATFSLIPP